jgi:hypothetical protein
MAQWYADARARRLTIEQFRAELAARLDLS